MTRTKSKLSILVLSIYLAAPAAIGQTNDSKSQQQQGKLSETQKTTLKAQAELHERIAKAHNNAGKCLTDEKRPESECLAQLSKECEAAGATAQCMPKSSKGMAGQISPDRQSSSN